MTSIAHQRAIYGSMDAKQGSSGYTDSRLRIPPLLEKPPQELFHEGVALGGHGASGGGVHAVLKQQQLLIKMVDRRTGAAFVRSERVMLLGRNRRIVNRAAGMAAVGEGAGDA